MITLIRLFREPLTIGAGAAIAAGAGLLGTGATAYASGKTNLRTRQWNEKMHALQRREALADWAMQNEYDSPRAQMQRFRDAGLNPNLIYGQTNQSGPIRSSDVQGWNPEAPRFEGIGDAAMTGLSAYYDTRLKEAQIDNVAKDSSIKMQEAILKAAQTAATNQATAKSEFDLQQSKALSKYSLQAAEQNIRNLMAVEKSTLDANDRANAMQGQNYAESVQRVLSGREAVAKSQEERKNIQQAREFAKTDNAIKQEDLKLIKQGIRPGDPIYLRLLAETIQGLLERASGKGGNMTRDEIERKKQQNPGHGPKSGY